MKVDLRKNYIGGPSMVVDFDAIPRKGEVICFNRTSDLNPNDANFLDEFYEENKYKTPELIVKDVIYHTGGNYPIVLLDTE